MKILTMHLYTLSPKSKRTEDMPQGHKPPFAMFQIYVPLPTSTTQ